MNWLRKAWAKYCDWCDSMGLTPESKRCCAPVLQDPELKQTQRRESSTLSAGSQDDSRHVD